MKLYLQFTSCIFFILLLAGLKYNCYSQVSPDDIPNLKLWLRADSLVDTTLTGSKVTQWNDCSGNNNNVIQLSSLLQPVLVNSVPLLNNEPVIHFDGSDDYMDGGNILNLGTNSHTIYIICKSNSTSGTFIAKSIAAYAAGRWALFYWAPNFMFAYEDNNDRSFTLLKNPIGYELIKAINNRGLSNNTAYSNGVLLGTSAINPTFDMTTSFNFLVGAYNSNTGGLPPYGFYLDGDIAEIIIYDTILSSQQQSLIEEYFLNKYSSTVNLGADIFVPYGFCDTVIYAGNNFATYNWSTGASTDTIHVHCNGTYSVTVTDNVFGLQSSDAINVTYPALNLHDTLFCSGSTVTLSTELDSAIGYTFLWSDLTTTDSILNVSVADNYSVTVTDANSCSAISDTIIVSEDDFPVTAWLGSDDSLCVGNTIELVAPDPLPQISSYIWSTFETSTFIAVDYPGGDYSLTVTNTNGCSARDTVNIYIAGNAPDVHFTATTGCSGAVTQFSTNTAGDTYLWDFGDGQTSTQQNPTHIYTAGNDTTVRLTVTDGICSSYKDSTIHIPQSPVAAFSTDTACAGHAYSFFDESICTEGNITYWDWDFGDAGPHLYDTNPQYTYTSDGDFNVTLIISTDSGCSDTVFNPITVVLTAPTPATFTLYLPSDSLVTTDTIIDFSWNTSPGAVTYTLEYSTDPFFTTIEESISNITGTSTQLNISSYGTYFWRVIAYGLCGDSIISNSYCFIIFSSATVSNMQLWLKADSALTNSNQVELWYDCSGNNNDVNQTDSLYQPILINSVDTINDKPVIRFDGTDDYLDGGNILNFGTNSNTIYIIGKSNFPTGTFIAKSMAAYSAGRWSISYWSPNFIYTYEDNSDRSITISKAPTGYELIKALNNRTLSSNSMYSNGILLDSPKLINPTFDMSTSFNFLAGAYNSVTGGLPPHGFYLDGDIAEIIMFNKVLSANEKNIVENYIQNKYSATVNLGPDIWTNDFCDTTLDASDRFISYLWNTGDTTSSISVNTGDTIWVDVVDVFGFPSSDTVVVHKPVVTAYGDTLCFGDSTTLYTGLGTPYTSSWVTATDSIVADSFVIHAGETVMLHVYDNSPDSCSVDRQIVMVADSFPLTSLLGAPTISICSGDTIFPAVDTIGITSYDWWYGSTHVYTPYFVVPASWVGVGANLWLSCTNSRGCIATDMVAVGVPGQSPVPNFSATAGCEPFINSFTDNSTVGGPGSPVINGWIWSFGDNDSAFVQNPTHNFDDPGIHLVTLTVSTNKGCSATVVDTALVYSKPVPAFSPLLGCTGIPLQFNDHTTNILGGLSSWSWNFGDPYSINDTSTLQSPTYIYDSSGYYTVHFVVVTEYGCTDSIDKVIYIRPSPQVDFSYTSVCDGNPVYFTNETVDELGIYQMYWDFSGTIYTTPNPIYTFDSAGTYPVILVVQSINGCTVHDTQYVVVHAIPTAVFVPSDDICVSYPDTLTESSTVLAPDVIAQWEWDFDAFGIYTGQNPVITFAVEGDYPVQLTVTSDAGCSGSTTATVHVNPIPTASFMPNEYYGMPPFTVTFDNTSVDALNSYWEFGDGDISTLTDPQHTYTTEDTFTVMLVVTNSALCTDTAYQEMYVIPTTADVAVTDVTTEKQGDFLKVSANIWNYGSRKIYALYLYAKASGGTMFMETWSDFVNPLLPDTSMLYNFNAQFAVPEEQSLDYICVEAQIQNFIPDDVPENNEECVTFNNNFSAFIPYPTPSNNEINIDFILPFKDQVVIDLYDIEGRLVEHIFSGEANKGLNKLTVDISELALAVYVYRITFNEDFRILRFVKY